MLNTDDENGQCVGNWDSGMMLVCFFSFNLSRKKHTFWFVLFGSKELFSHSQFVLIFHKRILSPQYVGDWDVGMMRIFFFSKFFFFSRGRAM